MSISDYEWIINTHSDTWKITVIGFKLISLSLAWLCEPGPVEDNMLAVLRVGAVGTEHKVVVL